MTDHLAADASATRAFFVDMLVRDIGVYGAILDCGEVQPTNKERCDRLVAKIRASESPEVPFRLRGASLVRVLAVRLRALRIRAERGRSNPSSCMQVSSAQIVGFSWMIARGCRL